MITVRPKGEARLMKLEKIETVSAYRPILGGILGYWHVLKSGKISEDIVLQVSAPLTHIDRLIVNGQVIPIPKEVTEIVV